MRTLKSACAWVENDLHATLFSRAPVWPEHLAQIQEALDAGQATLAESQGTGWVLTLSRPLPNMQFRWYRVEFAAENNEAAEQQPSLR